MSVDVDCCATGAHPDLRPPQCRRRSAKLPGWQRRAKFRSGDCITEAGASGEAAYLLVSGEAQRAAAPEELLPPGSLIGELAMLVDHAYAATIVAKGRVHCLKITRSAMHGLMLTDPSLADLLSQHITERLRKAASGLMRIDRLLAQERYRLSQAKRGS